MTRSQRWCVIAGMFLAGLAFGLSLGTRWSGASFFGALWCWILGYVLLAYRRTEVNDDQH